MEKELQEVIEEIKGDVSKTVADTVTAPITEKVFEQVMAKMPNRKDIFGSNKDEEALQAKKDAASKLKALVNGEVKSLSTATATEGAELVPTIVGNQIERIAAATGLVDRYGRKYPMSSSKENVPTADSVTAYRTSEAGLITVSQPTTGAIALSAKTVSVIVPFSRMLLNSSNPNVIDLITMLAGEAFATIKDRWALLGLAGGEGVFQHASVTGVTLGSGDTTYAKVEPEDMLDMINIIDDNISDSNLRWVLTRSVLNALRSKRAAVSTDKQGFLFQGFGSDLPATMWNIPYSLSPVLPKTTQETSQAGAKFMALMDFNKVLVGGNDNYTIEMSNEAVISDAQGVVVNNLFQQNMVAIKFTADFDIQLADAASAFAWCKTAAS